MSFLQAGRALPTSIMIMMPFFMLLQLELCSVVHADMTAGRQLRVISHSGLPASSETLPAKKNILGTDLQLCSTPGTALTGFTRTGHCIDSGNDDQGSHHICIKMAADFCKVTGQETTPGDGGWCVQESQCMGQAGTCPIKHWCVCQWAFARYLAAATSCDASVDVVCESTNMAAVKAYSTSPDPQHRAALACIKKKCPTAQVALNELTDAATSSRAAFVSELIGRVAEK